jgi:hypothetical protein
MKKKVWIVSELFYPEETATAYIFTRIANYLSESYQVAVICGPEFYDENKKEFKDDFLLSSNIEIFRTYTLKLNKNSLFQRTLKIFLLSFKMGILMCRNISKGETVILATNPALLLLFVQVIKYFKKFKLHILVHDVFPENTIPAKIFINNKQFVYKILKSLFDKAYASADHLIVLGRDMEIIISRKVFRFKSEPRISIIPNWSSPKNLDINLRNTTSEDIIKLQYAGNIGRVQGLKEIMEAFCLSDTKGIFLNIRGTGALYSDIEKIIDLYKLDNVSLGGGFSRQEEHGILADCDIGIVSLSSGMYGLGVPSKTYQLLSAGKPILFIGEPETEIYKFVLENQIGWSLDIGNKDELISYFNGLTRIDKSILYSMGNKSRLMAEKDFNETTILKLFQSKIELV